MFSHSLAVCVSVENAPTKQQMNRAVVNHSMQVKRFECLPSLRVESVVFLRA
jgi:hypothetical protein